MKNKVKKIYLLSVATVLCCCLSAQTPDEVYLEGVARIMQENYEEAVVYLTHAIDRDNSNEKYYLKRAESFYYLDIFDKAIADYEEANSIIPGCADLGLSRIYSRLGKQADAFTFLTRHLKSEFRESESVIQKDPAFGPLKQLDEWHDLWQQDWYNGLEKLSAETEYRIRKESPDNAIQYLDENRATFEKTAGYYALRAKVYGMQENHAAAIADYSMAVSLDKSDPDLYFNRGLSYLRADKFRNALEDFSKGLKSEPDRFVFYLERARAYIGLMEYDAALKDGNFYLKLFPEDQEAIELCGEICYRNEDYLNALKYFNLNLKSDPDNAGYYKARGKAYLKTKTFTYAINDLSMSLDLKPDDGETYMYLGLAKYETGDKTGACSDFQKAQKYGNIEALKYSIEYCGGK